MNARFCSTLALVLFATGCAQSDPEEATTPPADSAVETTVDTATPPDTTPADTSTEDTAETSVDASLCGNNYVNTGEECDDGNTKAGDGCSPECKWEPTSTADTCDGDAIPLTVTTTSDQIYRGSVSSDTSMARPNFTSKCGGGLANDLVYKFVAPTDGKAILTLEPEFAAVFSVRGACNDESTEFGCIDQSTPKIEPITLTIEITKGSTYFAIVDGYGGKTGKFKLNIETRGEKCGNGMIEGLEQCEDGNTLNGDGCSSSCRLEDGPELLSKCPGAALHFKTGASKTIHLADKFLVGSPSEGTCFVTTSNLNNFYAVTSDYPATMHLDMRNARGGYLVYVRSECAGLVGIGTPPDLGCAFDGTAGKAVLDVPVLPGRTYFVTVDSTIIFDKPDPGTYTLDITMNEPRCGNGILEAGEEWDDGNNVSGDGVSADCKMEPPVVADVCSTTPGTMPAIPVTLVDGTYKGIASGTTTGMTGGNFKTCPVGVSGPQAPDVVYRLHSPIDGLATVTVDGKFQPLISAFNACVDLASNMIACDNTAAQKISYPVKADTDTWLVVDSYASSKSGAYTVKVEITPPVCGNGVIEGTETCDDKNTTGGDGCDATCKLEPVTAHEKCADAELVTLTPDTSGVYKNTLTSGITNLANDQLINPCTTTSPAKDGKDAVFKIVAPIDGVLTARAMSASFDVSLGVRANTCTDTGAPLRCSETGATAIEEVRIAAVKDGVYYIVVDAQSAASSGPFTLELNVAPSKCGDGLLGGGEECDDGNTKAGDGCDATCKLEPAPGADTCPGYTVPFVADGTRQVALMTVDTSKLSADYAASCGGAAKDAVLSYTSPIAGKAVVEVLENDKAILHARSTCGDATTQLGCATKKLEFLVAAGKPFSVFVDGPPGVEGPATVRVTVTP